MTNRSDCLMCLDPIFTAPTEAHPLKIADLDVSIAIINKDWQFYRGTTILVYQDHVTELHHLTQELQNRFIADGTRVSAALEKLFPGIKLNHGLFGNVVSHLHWHQVVRRSTDPNPNTTIWESPIPTSGLSVEDLSRIASEIRGKL